jgi:Stress responsive A/B Barrel Domain
MTVRHIVMFSFKEGTTTKHVENLVAALLDLPSHIPGILSYEVGADMLLESGQNHPAGKNRVVSWTACFANVEDYEIYQAHPAHQAFVSDILKPILLPGSRAAIQYKIK